MPLYANVSRMPARQPGRGRAWALALVSVMGLMEPGMAEGLRVASVQARLGPNQLIVSGNAEIALTPKVEEALNNGIPLEFVVEVRLHRRRALIWDQIARSFSARRELRYHALAGQYLVTRRGPGEPTRASFQALAEALAAVGSLDESLALDPPLEGSGDYRVGVRVHLDIEALPPVLRPVAYTARAWDLNSGWTMWTVQP